MKKIAMFKITNSGMYTGLDLNAEHEFVGIAEKSRRGDIVLNVKHLNGLTTDLSFKWDEVRQVNSLVAVED